MISGWVNAYREAIVRLAVLLYGHELSVQVIEGGETSIRSLSIS